MKKVSGPNAAGAIARAVVAIVVVRAAKAAVVLAANAVVLAAVNVGAARRVAKAGPVVAIVAVAAVFNAMTAGMTAANALKRPRRCRN